MKPDLQIIGNTNDTKEITEKTDKNVILVKVTTINVFMAYSQ